MLGVVQRSFIIIFVKYFTFLLYRYIPKTIHSPIDNFDQRDYWEARVAISKKSLGESASPSFSPASVHNAHHAQAHRTHALTLSRSHVITSSRGLKFLKKS